MRLINSFFNKYFIKNDSHDVIYVFKNYFIVIFSLFNFRPNKPYRNTPSITLLSEHYLSKNNPVFSSPKPTARPQGRPSSDVFLTFEAPAPASEQHQLRRARTPRPTLVCQEVPTILPPSASLLRFLYVLFILFSIFNAL